MNPCLIYVVTPKDCVNFLCGLKFTKNQILTIMRSSSYDCENPSLNQMKVTQFWLNLEPLEEGAYLNVDLFVLQLVKEGVVHNTTGGVHEPKSDSGSKFEFFRRI
ncbi:unnamed protein product [Vicia faba]|uniref:Uncharacterized protein n=1 Tax=Vicia faba TaxID=3906 RepID=A0AAV0YFI9_VICFA|nr:unnamed protein product [Vicia faba]